MCNVLVPKDIYVDPLDWTEGIESLPVYSDDKCDIKTLKLSKYVKCNIPGPGANIDDFEEQILGCQCFTPNCENDCICLEKYGRNYENKLLRKSHLHLNQQANPIFECNKQCTCESGCINRVVQHGINIQLQVFMTNGKGIGLRPLEKVTAGQFVCEYAGEILSVEDAKKRTLLQTENDMNYILTVKEYHKNGIITTYVDPTFKGNIGRYINHSCTPNLVMVPVRVDNMVPKICLFALCDIEPNEELSFHYGFNGNSETRLDRTCLKPCFCKTENCQGYLPFDESLFG